MSITSSGSSKPNSFIGIAQSWMSRSTLPNLALQRWRSWLLPPAGSSFSSAKLAGSVIVRPRSGNSFDTPGGGLAGAGASFFCAKEGRQRGTRTSSAWIMGCGFRARIVARPVPGNTLTGHEDAGRARERLARARGGGALRAACDHELPRPGASGLERPRGPELDLPPHGDEHA